MKKEIGKIYVKKFFYFNIYVIKGKTGDILIDTGFIGIHRKLKRWLNQFDIKLIILTHAHVDHIWNTAYLKKIYNCDVAIGKNDIENLDNTKINSIPSNNNHKRWTKLMNYGMNLFSAESFEIDMELKDNQIIKRYGIDLKIISLPGHTNGSIGIMYKDYLFAGDALVYRKKYPEIAYQNQNNNEAINSYKKIINLAPQITYIGHDKKIPLDKLKSIKI